MQVPLQVPFTATLFQWRYAHKDGQKIKVQVRVILARQRPICSSMVQVKRWHLLIGDPADMFVCNVRDFLFFRDPQYRDFSALF